MDRVERYREIVRRVVEEYALAKPAFGQIDTEVVADHERDHYEVLLVGWDDQRRIHHSVVHVDIIDGKVWIQHDSTDRPIADELVAAGIPKSDIVLAFHPADVRIHTGFATG
jgi:hypothetical protein